MRPAAPDLARTRAPSPRARLEIGMPVFATKDAMEGPRAFAEKRKLVFRGE